MGFSSSIDPNRVAAYIRWSTEEQSDGTTLEVQQEACKLFIESQGWRFREDLLFIDDGHSGGTLDRPALNRMRKAVSAGKISCVVVYKLDRLSRSVLDTVKLVLEEWEGVCFIRSTREPIDTSSPTGTIFFYMLASYAEWERSVIRERTMSGKIKRAQQGKNPGFTAPYGYRTGNQPGQFVIHEDEAAVVSRIFRDYIGGLGINSIAGRLNAEGVRNRKGTYWNGAAVAHIVANPFYKGTLRYGVTSATSQAQRRQIGKARISFDQPRWAHVEGAVPAIISVDDFERAQKVKSGRASVVGFRNRSGEFLMTGIARCKCGATIRGDGRANQGYRYYRCSGDWADNPTPCGCGVIPADQLDEAVITAVRAAVAPSNRENLLSNWHMDLVEKVKESDQKVQQVKGSLHQLDQTRARMTADYRSGDLSAKLFSIQMEDLDREEEALRRSLEGLAAERQQLESAQLDFSTFDDLVHRVDSWDALDQEERKQVLRHLVAKCSVYRKRNGSSKHNANPIEVDLEIRRRA